ncbi:SIP domain-containing protein [Acinetobacter sp. c1-l78]|uniref:SIP domain-containing protein n=1 Tax=Acinetobacter sp. c1-l78 TaxID=3342803 RepID=UPI0035B93F2F
MKRTPVADQQQKLDIIDHVNQDHGDEILVIAHYYNSKDTFTSAYISDIFNEGMTLKVTSQTTNDIFIPFELKGELEEQILYLAYLAMVKQGKDITGGKRRYFTVTHKSNITKRMVRLHLSSQTSIAKSHDGYAYGMVLKTMQGAQPKELAKTTSNHKIVSWLKTRANLGFLWVLKKVSSEKRQKIVESMNKDIRIYTMRIADDDQTPNDIYMDIYAHGDSAGYRWLDSIQSGDIIYSRTESPEIHNHLANGNAVLIADETAYPAVASILESWENPLPPTLIVLSQYAEEQAYFDKVRLPTGTTVHHIVADVSKQSEKTLEYLTSLTAVQTVWGACETSVAKDIRHYFRNDRQLPAKNNHFKGYWRLK